MPGPISEYITGNATGTSITLTMTNPVQVGDTILVFFCAPPAASPTAATDTLGNSYSVEEVDSGSSGAFWEASAVSASAGTGVGVTVAFSPGASFIDAVLLHCAGLGPLDQFTTGTTDNSTPLSSGYVTTTSPTELLIGVACTEGAPGTVTTPTVADSFAPVVGYNQIGVSQSLVTSVGNYQSVWNVSGPSAVPAVVQSKVLAFSNAYYQPTDYAEWSAGNPYALNAEVVDYNGQVQKVTSAGTSGATAPNWNTSLGGTTTDNGVTWTNQSGVAVVPTVTLDSPVTAGNVVLTFITFDTNNVQNNFGFRDNQSTAALPQGNDYGVGGPEYYNFSPFGEGQSSMTVLAESGTLTLHQYGWHNSSGWYGSIAVVEIANASGNVDLSTFTFLGDIFSSNQAPNPGGGTITTSSSPFTPITPNELLIIFGNAHDGPGVGNITLTPDSGFTQLGQQNSFDGSQSSTGMLASQSTSSVATLGFTADDTNAFLGFMGFGFQALQESAVALSTYPVTFVPIPLPTTTALTVSRNPVLANTSDAVVTLTAVVTGPNSPTGTVTLTDTFNGAVIYTNTATLVLGQATFTPPSLAFGQHEFTASYSGDSLNDPSSAILLAASVQKVMTNASFSNRIWFQCNPNIGPFTSTAFGKFDPTQDFKVWIDGTLTPITLGQFDANNNRYLLYTQKPFNIEGVIQVAYHVPNPPFFDAGSPPAPIPGLVSIAAFTTLGDSFLPPSASLSATPSTISSGESVTLSWTVFNVARVSITDTASLFNAPMFPTNPTGGSVTIPAGILTSTDTFTLHTFDANGNPLPPAPTVTVTVI